jgi:hypothetical protein
MPKPKHINARVIWDRNKLDLAFEAIPDGSDRAEDIWEKSAV